MRALLTWAVIGCAEAALWVSGCFKAAARHLVANDLNSRDGRHRSDGK